MSRNTTGQAAVGVATTASMPRRNWVFGVGAAGAAALAVKALPPTPAALVSATAALKPVVEATGGYQLTAHVLRYYETARS
jgi:hypothetical protein